MRSSRLVRSKKIREGNERNCGESHKDTKDEIEDECRQALFCSHNSFTQLNSRLVMLGMLFGEK